MVFESMRPPRDPQQLRAALALAAIFAWHAVTVGASAQIADDNALPAAAIEPDDDEPETAGGLRPSDDPGAWEEAEEIEVEEEEEEEEILPSGHPLTRYTSIWENSPFLREVVRPAETMVASTFGRDLVLEGLVHDRRAGPVAYVRDRRDNRLLTLKTEAQGDVPYRIESAELDRDPTKSVLVITDGRESATIRFAENLLTQRIAPAPAAAPAAAAEPSLQPREASALTPEAAAQVAAKGGRPPRQIPSQTPDGEGAADPTEKLDKLDAEPRRRRIMLPGASSQN